MKRPLFTLVALISFATMLSAAPTPPPNPNKSATKTDKNAGGTTSSVSSELAKSANGWIFAKGEWVHPEGYKFVNGKILRTTAKVGMRVPYPPGKLALDNPQKLTSTNAPMVDKKAPADPAPPKKHTMGPSTGHQTGTNM